MAWSRLALNQVEENVGEEPFGARFWNLHHYSIIPGAAPPDFGAVLHENPLPDGGCWGIIE